jgi:hypothetical protein
MNGRRNITAAFTVLKAGAAAFEDGADILPEQAHAVDFVLTGALVAVRTAASRSYRPLCSGAGHRPSASSAARRTGTGYVQHGVLRGVKGGVVDQEGAQVGMHLFLGRTGHADGVPDGSAFGFLGFFRFLAAFLLFLRFDLLFLRLIRLENQGDGYWNVIEQARIFRQASGFTHQRAGDLL